MSVACVSDGLRWSSSLSDCGEEEEDRGRGNKRQMTMQQLVSCYGHKLPVIVSVVDGFFGCYGNEIGSEEVFWICDMARQERILVRDKINRYYSIPTDYELQFHMFSEINDKNAQALSLREVVPRLASAALPLIMLKDDQPVTFGTGGGGGSRGGGSVMKRSTTTFARLGVLEVIDAYELQYLQAHSIYESKMNPQSTYIPVFLDLSFVVAVGCLHGNDDDFRRWMAKVNAIGQRLSSQSKPVMCNEIIFLDCESSSVDRCYEYMRPRNLVLTHGVEHQYEHIISDTTTHTPTSFQTDPVVDEGVAVALPPLLPSTAESSSLGSHGTGGGTDSAAVDRESRGDTDESSHPPPPPIPERRTGLRCTTQVKKTRPPPPPSPPLTTPSDPVLRGSSHDETDLSPSETHSSAVGATENVSQRHLLQTNETSHLALTREGASSSSSSSSLAVTASSATSDETSTFRQYLFASDVPRDLDFRCLSKADVAHCLCLLNLWQFGLSFESLDINGALLLELNEDILITDLGFTARGARKLMRFAKEKWRPSKSRNH